MAILDFQKPDKVIMLEANDYFGKFEFRPLEPGFGHTIGNAIRRILLSSIEGYAITCIRIEGVEHEFSTIPGIVQDITEIVLNFKQIRFKKIIEEQELPDEDVDENSEYEEEEIDNEIQEINEEIDETEKAVVTIINKEEFRAGDLNNFFSNFEVLNKDLLICTLDPSVKLQVEITIEKGRGYVPADENQNNDLAFGSIPIDAIYTPIKNVKYDIENYRVAQKTDYEKLNLEITTDGSIHPKDALKETAKILIHHFMLFSDERITLNTEEKEQNKEFDEEILHMRQLLKKKLVDLDLSVRALNCLKAAEVNTLGELVTFNKDDLLKFRNFGKKSLAELEELLENMKLEFSMDVTKYNLNDENE